jgi:hypothetical protein
MPFHSQDVYNEFEKILNEELRVRRLPGHFKIVRSTDGYQLVYFSLSTSFRIKVRKSIFNSSMEKIEYLHIDTADVLRQVERKISKYTIRG